MRYRISGDIRRKLRNSKPRLRYTLLQSVCHVATEFPFTVRLLGNHEWNERPFTVLNGINTVVERKERNVCEPLTDLRL